MKKKMLFGAWVLLYIICWLIGHEEEPTGMQAVAMTILSLMFFVPGVLLLVDALGRQDKKVLKILRWICVGSLSLTMIFLVANVLSALGSELLGTVLYEILIFVSVPMISSQHWVLSLFCWACLLFATWLGRKKK